MHSILHVDSSISGPHSASRQLSAQVVAKQIQLLGGEATVVPRDLVADALLHLSPAHLAAVKGDSVPSEEVGNDLALGAAYIDEVFAADVIVIGCPMYNFTIPSQLKGWLDRLMVAGLTFRYTANGPEGLVPKGKKVFVVSTRGGVYSSASPMAALDYQEGLLVTSLNFIGLSDVTIVRAEGLAMGEEAKVAALAGATAAIDALAA